MTMNKVIHDISIYLLALFVFPSVVSLLRVRRSGWSMGDGMDRLQRELVLVSDPTRATKPNQQEKGTHTLARAHAHIYHIDQE